VKITVARALGVIVVAGIGGGVVWALWPRPVEVDVAEVAHQPMRVMVEEDGATRIRERYVVSAPLGGRLARVTLDPGDVVVANETVLATIEPTDPALLDARAQAEAEARVSASEAVVEQATAAVTRAEAALELAERDLARLQAASEADAVTPVELERAMYAELFARQDVRAAHSARAFAMFELEQARSALLRTQGGGGEAGFVIRSPVSGRVLRVFQESVAVVSAGVPLIELGDPDDLEAVVDVLSVDAVGIRPGDAVEIERWGGDTPLRGAVRLVEPAAFTKLSSLGVEEQRVNVVIDLLDPPDVRAGLGDGFRVEAGIVIWRAESTLVAPESALFRHDSAWAAFVVDAGRAVLRPVHVGRRNGIEAQVVDGLSAGDQVILHPGDRVTDGGRVRVRSVAR
jgi:HlyD family secretion protein